MIPDHQAEPSWKLSCQRLGFEVDFFGTVEINRAIKQKEMRCWSEPQCEQISKQFHEYETTIAVKVDQTRTVLLSLIPQDFPSCLHRIGAKL